MNTYRSTAHPDPDHEKEKKVKLRWFLNWLCKIDIRIVHQIFHKLLPKCGSNARQDPDPQPWVKYIFMTTLCISLCRRYLFWLGGEAVALSDRLVRGRDSQAQRGGGDVTYAGSEPCIAVGSQGLDSSRRGRTYHRLRKGIRYKNCFCKRLVNWHALNR